MKSTTSDATTARLTIWISIARSSCSKRNWKSETASRSKLHVRLPRKTANHRRPSSSQTEFIEDWQRLRQSIHPPQAAPTFLVSPPRAPARSLVPRCRLGSDREPPGPSLGSGRDLRPAEYDLAEPSVLHRFGGLFDRDPLDVPLILLGPLLPLTGDVQGEDVHVKNCDAPFLEPLLVPERPHGASSDCSKYPRLLESFAGSRVAGCSTTMWPSLRDDPALLASRRHKHDLGARGPG